MCEICKAVEAAVTKAEEAMKKVEEKSVEKAIPGLDWKQPLMKVMLHPRFDEVCVASYRRFLDTFFHGLVEEFKLETGLHPIFFLNALYVAGGAISTLPEAAAVEDDSNRGTSRLIERCNQRALDAVQKEIQSKYVDKSVH